MGFDLNSLMWVLAAAEGESGGFLSKKVLIIIVAVIVLGVLYYWFKGRGK